MDVIIKSTLNTLLKSKNLLSLLSDQELRNSSISPYYSSIGSHLRHVLDFYDCILNKNLEGNVDLTARKRDEKVECFCNTAMLYLEFIEGELKTWSKDMEEEVYVIDDLGLGRVKIKYTYGALLAQANSHAIHHYAIISHVIDRLRIDIKDHDFGYNPTTPKRVNSQLN